MAGGRIRAASGQRAEVGPGLMFDEVTELLEGAVADGIVPGISVCVSSSERQVYLSLIHI